MASTFLYDMTHSADRCFTKIYAAFLREKANTTGVRISTLPWILKIIYLQYLMFAAPEQEVYPDILHPFSSQYFLSDWVSLPEGDTHCSHELPDPHKKHSPEPLCALLIIIKDRENMHTIKNNRIFFIAPPFCRYKKYIVFYQHVNLFL